MNDKHSDTYEQRQASLNVAEARFEFYLTGEQVWFTRLGFDETNNPVPDFYKLHPFIRSLPDYLIHLKGKLYFVHVKGTDKLKMVDFRRYCEFEDLYCTPDTPLFLAFCFKDGEKPITKSMAWLRRTVPKLTVREFPSDGKKYVSLPV